MALLFACEAGREGARGLGGKEITLDLTLRKQGRKNVSIANKVGQSLKDLPRRLAVALCEEGEEGRVGDHGSPSFSNAPKSERLLQVDN